MTNNNETELLSVLMQLADAAECYAADQARATDPRCGLVQPVTVAEANELNEALAKAYALIKKLEAL